MKRFKEHKPVVLRGTFFRYDKSNDGRGTFTMSAARETSQSYHYHRFMLELSISDTRCAIRALRQFVKAERDRVAALVAYTGVDND